MKPKVSIIIPCYNQAKFLPKAIESLQAQTLAEWECIVVDDGSTDNTAEVANNLALNDARISLIQKRNGGLASARNRGLLYAQGDFIQLLDADDSIFPEKLERQVTLMTQKGLDLSYTAFCHENSKGERTKSQFVHLNRLRIILNWGLGFSVPIHSFLYNKAFIQKNKLIFHHSSREDYEWHLDCFAHHPYATTLPDFCGAIYFHNEEGMTGNYIRMQEGNFEFMAYLAHKMKGVDRILWAFRISEELWIWLLRMIKYRSIAIIKSILLLDTAWIVAALILMPVSIWWIVIYFIKTYIAK